MKNKPPKGKLKSLYESGMTGEEMADKFGVCSSTIYNWMDNYNIDRKDRRECQESIEIDKAALKELYEEQESTLIEIAERYDCSQQTILRLLNKYNIETRNRTYACAGWNKGLSKENDERICKYSKKISETRKRKFENGKIEHWNKGNEWSEEVKQKISESLKGKITGSDHPNWKGGWGSEYRRWKENIRQSKEYKDSRKKVYERDNYTCQKCYKKSDGDLQLHHIIPVHKVPERIMEEKNCITLCRKCHESIKSNELKWAGFFYEQIYS